MRRLAKATFLVMAQLAFAGSAHASSPLCVAGCVKADVDGLKDVADAMKQWAQMLPGLNERFHEGVRDDLREMNRVATDLVDTLDRMYGKNLDLTDQKVRGLMAEAVARIDEIGNNALNTYKRALFESECTAESIGEIFKGKIEESIPRFQWIRSLFGEKFNVLSSTDFQGDAIELTFDPDSRTDRFQAAYNLMTEKISSADQTTKLAGILAVALDRQRLAYSYYCATRASVGSMDGVGHVYDMYQVARQEYLVLSGLTNFSARR
ncbi:hypothetical protein N185_16375 [Sinorhizobium sp. GW3]|nr:hypothetical protein N185_16375 [Sinorhizobium sp. GW3]